MATEEEGTATLARKRRFETISEIPHCGQLKRGRLVFCFHFLDTRLVNNWSSANQAEGSFKKFISRVASAAAIVGFTDDEVKHENIFFFF